MDSSGELSKSADAAVAYIIRVSKEMRDHVETATG
tara:strand:- start:149 stop:253 length:105 start_codon:yes stop_codon:yes gene_type:complete